MAKHKKGNRHINIAAAKIKRMKDKTAGKYLKSFYGGAYRDGYADAAEAIIEAVEEAIEETDYIGSKISKRLRLNIQNQLKDDQIIAIEIKEDQKGAE